MEKIKTVLEVFDIITYKDICSLLDEIPKTGNSKKAHIKEFERYCQIETHGRGKFKVLEIYDIPKDKIGRGQHENSRLALKKYNDSNKVFQDDILRQSILYFHFIKASNILNIPINDLINTDNDNIFSINIRPYELFEWIGICNNETSKILENKQDLIYNDIFKEYDIKPSYIVTNNLFNSMKNKVIDRELKDIVSYERLIIYDNNQSRQVLGYEEQIIKQVEQDVINSYNENKKTDYKYSDIYSLPKSHRMMLQNIKRNRLQDKLTYYDYDIKCFIISNSIKSDIEELGLNNMTKEQIIQLGQELKQQINLIYYEHEKNRITKYYDEQIDKIKHGKSYGNIEQAIIKIEQDKTKSIELLDYLIKI